ncbi:MAG: phosphoribosylformylglycinamidine cyclo-ligase, partial [Anaerolineae bacterium]|nr:phosphoribosylformylglycinamidine cyclo-ligase [Anaerolineae bacterium]
HIFLPNIGAKINRGAWDIPPIFSLMQRKGSIITPEMYRVFNMGIGMILVIPVDQVDKTVEIIPTANRIGEIVEGRGVQLV